jgi:hypothetical protein
MPFPRSRWIHALRYVVKQSVNSDAGVVGTPATENSIRPAHKRLMATRQAVGLMTNERERIRIDLTPEQQQQVKTASGHDAVALEFSVEELEQRIAPSDFSFVRLGDASSPKLYTS